MGKAYENRENTSDRSDPHDLGTELRIAVARLARRLRAEKPDDALSDGQFSVLALLNREGPRTLGELSEHERVTPPSMNRTVGCLVDAGYVARTASPDDGRKVVLHATEAGNALVTETRRRRDAWIFHRIDELDPAEVELLAQATTLLRRLADS